MAERQSLPTQIATYAGVATIAAGLLDGLRGFETYISDITAQDPESYARANAMHAMFPWTQAPSLNEAFAQQSAATTPDVATAAPLVEALTNAVHMAVNFIPEVAVATLIVVCVVGGLKFRHDMLRAANNIDTTRRNRPTT